MKKQHKTLLCVFRNNIQKIVNLLTIFLTIFTFYNTEGYYERFSKNSTS